MIKIKVLLTIALMILFFFLGTLSYKIIKDNNIPDGWIDDGVVCKPIDTK